MKIGEFITKYREEHDKMSGRAFADLVDLSPQYVFNLERGFNNNGKPLSPTMKTYAKIAKGIGMSETELLSLLNDSVTVNPQMKNIIDIGIAEKYNALDEHGRSVVDFVINAEYQRCTAEPEPEAEPKTKIIPLFTAAAGKDEQVDNTPFRDYEVDADSKAEFAVKINGDSMEPELRDGEVVLCVRRKAEIGEIAVIMVNGFLYVKQYIADSFGNIYLRSLNRQRKDLDVDIMASGNDTVTGYGVVIHRRVPLVRE